MKRYVYSSSIDNDEEKIKEWISTDILKIQDKGLETALRRILFNPNNKIDWQDAVRQIEYEMPEGSQRLEFMKLD